MQCGLISTTETFQMALPVTAHSHMSSSRMAECPLQGNHLSIIMRLGLQINITLLISQAGEQIKTADPGN